ncbi:MAG: hypothetical protein ACQESB_03285 [Elusimicrobiota bacterium]
MKNRLFSFAALSLVFLCGCASSRQVQLQEKETGRPGGGMRISEGRIIMQDVPLGTKVSISDITGESIKISNEDNNNRSFKMEVYRCEEKNVNISHRNEDIPDTEWIQPEKEILEVPAGSSKEAVIHINIPDKEKYAGKRYQAVLEITREKKNPNEFIVLAAEVSLNIITAE